MREIDLERIVNYGVLIGILCGMIPLLHRLPRTRGKNILFQVGYFAVVGLTIAFLPADIQEDIFSPGGVVVVGTVLPVYESIVAVCTPGEEDDTAWLQYWVAAGFLTYTTEWIDTIKETFPNGGEHWYEFEFFITLWLLLPFTDGASLIYDVFTEPYVAPTARKLKTKFEGWISFIVTMVNISYMYLLWFTFMSLPEEARRFMCVAVGTIYPGVASIVAITTKDNTKVAHQFDDTYWLTVSKTFSLHVCVCAGVYLCTPVRYLTSVRCQSHNFVTSHPISPHLLSLILALSSS